MENKLVDYTLEEGIAVVTIDNPPVNAMDVPTREALASVFDELSDKKDEVKVVILTSAGEKVFVSGADIRRFVDMTPETAMASVRRSRTIYSKVDDCEAPVICAIRGHCFGGGLELAMCCDLRIVAEEAKLGLPEVGLGIMPGGGGTKRLAWLVGAGIAKEIIYTGRPVTPQQALSIGLVNKAVPRDQVLDEAKEMAKLIATKGPLAVRAAKKAVNGGLNLSLSEALDLEADLFSSLFTSGDPREGATAFLEKRPPVFKGK